MNKDAILASIIGFGIGLLITGGVIVGPRLLSQLNRPTSGDVASATTRTNTTASPTPETPQTQQALSIDSPEKESIVKDSTITVSGKAPQQATLVIGSTEDEKIVETGTNTTYQTTLAIKEGKNDISVVSILNGKSTVERITVYYSAEK